MTQNKYTKNPIPQVEEQQFLNEEQQTIQKILNDFKQPIPSNYVKLKVEEGNYQFSTSSKWKDKPNYERYGFYLEEDEEKWVQIDIPHNLVENLEIEKGDDITYPIYLTIDISQKKLVRGAYTIENEEEVFIDKPVSEKNVEKELMKRLKELEKLRKQVNELENLKHEKVNLEEKVNDYKKTIQEKDEEINEKERQVNHREELIEKGIKIKEKLQKELEGVKNKNRSWKSFYDWLLKEVVEVSSSNPEERIVKKSKWKEYPVVAQFETHNKTQYTNQLLLSLEITLGIPTPNYVAVKYPVLPYDESKDFSFFYIRDVRGDNDFWYGNSRIYNYRKDLWGEYEKMFEDWKKDTPLQTTT